MVLWAHAREGRGIRKPTESVPYAAQVNQLLNRLGKILFDYFNGIGNTPNDQVNFDQFHQELCDNFLNVINSIRLTAGLAEMSYGQAQKLINLTFKYLSTYSDYDDFADLFSFAHMTIDAIVLGNLSPRKASILFGLRIVNRVNGLVGSQYHEHGWTAFTKEDYLHLVGDYRNAFNPHLGHRSYMDMEYHMWPTLTPFAAAGVMAPRILRFHK